MHARGRQAISTIAALGLVVSLAACGSSSGSSSAKATTTTTAGGSSATTATTAASGGSSGASATTTTADGSSTATTVVAKGGGAFCSSLAAVENSQGGAAEVAAAGNPAKFKALVLSTQAKEKSILAMTPAAIKSDVVTVFNVSDAFYAALAKVNYDATKLSPAALAGTRRRRWRPRRSRSPPTSRTCAASPPPASPRPDLARTARRNERVTDRRSEA